MSTPHRTAIALAVLAALALPAAAVASSPPPPFPSFSDVDTGRGGLADAIRQSGLPPVAHASDEYDAADEVERVLDRRNPRYDWHAFCRQVGARKYTCRISGWRGYDHGTGRAEVTKRSTWTYSVRIVSLRYELD